MSAFQVDSKVALAATALVLVLVVLRAARRGTRPYLEPWRDLRAVLCGALFAAMLLTLSVAAGDVPGAVVPALAIWFAISAIVHRLWPSRRRT